ncbi:MAG: hypothetical protein EKK46_10390 [Rhodocyclaceae bacterium]|nr:MAG: hypothetical protein EKK46_10390 [Rhodocyclaceae bacterium]
MGIRCHARSAAAFVALAVSLTAAADEADVFNLVIGRSALQDDNVFRLAPSANAQALLGSDRIWDRIDTTRLDLSLDKTIGRQRLRMDADMRRNRYWNFSRFDNDGSSLKGSLSWTLTDLIGGEVTSSSSTSLSGFGNGQTQAPVRNINTVNNASANVSLRIHPAWHMVLGVSTSGSSNDSPQGSVANARIGGSSAALRYDSGGGTEAGLTSSLSKARYPNPQQVSLFFVDNSYDDTSLMADVSVLVTGASRLSATLGQTRRTMRQLTERNFSGPTGSVGWTWQPTGKSTLTLRRSRDLGAAGDLNASYVVNDGSSLSATWAAGAKTQVALSLEHKQSRYLGDPVAVATAIPKRDDTLDSVALSASYQALRTLKLDLSLRYDARNSNYDGTAATTDFRFHSRSASFNVEYTF